MTNLNNKNKEVLVSERIYFPELDGLRFFAFLLVFIHHHSLFSQIPYLSIIHAKGWIGVDLFFVLSAFLFTKLLIAEFKKTQTISFKKFYIRRIFRIWPIYYLFVGITILIYLLKGGVLKDVGNRIIGLFTFTDNIFSAVLDYSPIPFTGHLWTISFEEQFYIFIPIIILFLVRSSYRTKIISAILVILIFNIIRFILIAHNIPALAIWVLPFTHFESIILGIIIGFSGLDFLVKSIKPLLLFLIGILFFLLLCLLPMVNNISILSYWLILSYSLVGLSTSLILLSVLSSDVLKKLFMINIFVFLGKRSYGLYVYHLLGNYTSDLMIKHIPELPSNSYASFSYSLTLTIIVAIISYAIIEKPFLKLKHKFEVIVSRPI